MENLSCYLLLIMLPLVFFIILKRYSSHHKSLNLPPSPPSLPLLGHFHLINNSLLHLSLASLSSRYGPIISLRFGCKSFVVVSSPSAVAECFSTRNDVVLANRPTSMAGDLITYNYVQFLSSPYGHLWRTLRRFSVVELLSSNSLHKSARLRQAEIRKIVRVLFRGCRNGGGQRVDLNNLIATYSFNIMMRALAGKPCLGEEDIGSEVGKETIERMKGIFVPSMELGICDYFPVLRWIGYKGLEKNLICLFKKRDEFLESLFDQKSGDDTNLIATLLSRQVSDPEFYTHDVIKSTVLVLILAGTDTSALTVEWGMSLLLSHPEELLKLRKEIDENVGDDDLLNDSDLVKLPYLACVVNETLRLHPAAPLLFPHYASEDCVVGGYSIPAGTIVLVNAWAMHRDPNLWEEPDRFNPGRFEAVGVDGEGHKFVPFGIGRRACPGAAMAMRTISLALGAFIQCFEWQKPLEEVEMDFNANLRITLHKAKPLEAVCIPRNQAAHLLSQL
ncbi:hypothetical protein ACS0TY_023610 [Phlomoides rotata]